jgi:hypothetical protein
MEIVEELKNMQNKRKGALRPFKIENRKLVDKADFTFTKKKSQLFSQLEAMPIEVLRVIAEKEYETQSVNRLSEHQLVNIIYNKATISRNTLEALNLSQYSGQIESVQVLMNNMISNNILDFNKKTYTWMYKDKEGHFVVDGTSKGVLHIGPAKEAQENKEKKLLEYLLGHPDIIEDFRIKLREANITV